MARIPGVEPQGAGLFTRLIYWLVRRKMAAITGQARLIEPVKILAHHPRLLRAYGQMEQAQAAAATVPAPLKALASLRAAQLVGCPF